MICLQEITEAAEAITRASIKRGESWAGISEDIERGFSTGTATELILAKNAASRCHLEHLRAAPGLGEGEPVRLIHGEALEALARLATEGVKVDAVISDPPYGVTRYKWDSVIPIPALWEGLHKVAKDNAALALFGCEPFSSSLRMSNLKEFKYDWVWKKSRVLGFLNAKKQPLRCLENVSIFYRKPPTYNPQGVEPCLIQDSSGASNFYGKHKHGRRLQTQTGYPRQLLEFTSVMKLVHPTQKPLALMEYLVATYTNPGETVLDFAMGSGTTGVACKKLGRRFIGIELEEKFFDIAGERIAAVTLKEGE